MQYEMVRLERDLGLRVWQEERLDWAWRLAYREGDDETIVTFPDSQALDDFIAERLGLTLIEPLALEAA